MPIKFPILLVGLLVPAAVTAEPMRKLSFGMKPWTVDAGHVQVELGVASAMWADSATGMTQTTSLFAFDAKLGVSSRVDLELAFAPWIQRTRDGEESSTSGIGDTTVRAKINLLGNDGGAVVIAIVPRITLPTSDELGGGVYAGGLTVPVAIRLPASVWAVLAVDGRSSLDADTEHTPMLTTSATFSRQVVGPFVGVLGNSAAFSADLSGPTRWTTNGCARLLLGVDGEVDAGVQFDTVHPSQRVNPYLAVTWRH